MGGPSLHAAAAHGNISELKKLLEGRASKKIGKAELEAPDQSFGGWSAVHLAARFGRTGVAEVLLEHRVETVWHGSEDSVAFDVNLPAGGGLTPMHAAAIGGHAEIVSLLLKHGADPNREDDKLGFTPLHYAVRAGADYLVATLVKNGADADRPDKFGATALQEACLWSRDVHVAKALLDVGADPDRLNQNTGQSAADIAASRGAWATVQLLQNRAADSSAAPPEAVVAKAPHLYPGQQDAGAEPSPTPNAHLPTVPSALQSDHTPENNSISLPLAPGQGGSIAHPAGRDGIPLVANVESPPGVAVSASPLGGLLPPPGTLPTPPPRPPPTASEVSSTPMQAPAPKWQQLPTPHSHDSTFDAVDAAVTYAAGTSQGTSIADPSPPQQLAAQLSIDSVVSPAGSTNSGGMHEMWSAATSSLESTPGPPLPTGTATSAAGKAANYTDFCLNILSKQHPDIAVGYIQQILNENNNNIEATDRMLVDAVNQRSDLPGMTSNSGGNDDESKRDEAYDWGDSEV